MLVGGIRAYRRWLSGRGPLRRVRCTFDAGHGGESCSAFGLRAAEEAPGVRVALGRIRRRIRRCGGVSLFALDAPDGTRALGWGHDHDRPLAELVADGEGEAARSLVLSSREVAARWRGHLADIAAARALRSDAAPLRPALRGMPPLALLARALAWRVVLAAAVVALVASRWPHAGAVVAALLRDRPDTGRADVRPSAAPT